MDLIGFNEEIFNNIKRDYNALADELNIENRYFVPVSALEGDNVVNRSSNMPWYSGKTLLELLETIEIADDIVQKDFRFPVQYVNRPNLNFRGFCGTILSGSLKVGDNITVLPSGKTTKVKSIIDAGDVSEKSIDNIDKIVNLPKKYHAPMAVTITTEDEVDISRGDMIVCSNKLPRVSNSLKVMLVWMDEESMVPQKSYDIKIATSLVNGKFDILTIRSI